MLAPVEELLVDAEGLVAEDEHGGAARREAAHHLRRLRLGRLAHLARARVRVRVRVGVRVRDGVRVRVRLL